MTRNEYMQRLERRMQGYPAQFREEVLDSFRQHFENGAAEGKSEQEIINSLGSIDEIMESIDGFSEEKKPNLNEKLREFSDYLGETFSSLFENVSATMNQSFENVESEQIEDFEDIQDLMIVTQRGTADISVEKGDVLAYRFGKTARSDAQVTIERKDNRLYIKVDGRGIGVSGHLSVQVPENIEGLYLSTDSCDIDIGDLSLQRMVARTISGDVEANNVEGQEMVIKGTSSDIELEKCYFDRITVETVSGDVETESCSGEMYVSSASGDIDAENHAGKLYVSTASGDIDAELVDAYDATLRSKSGDIDLKVGSRDFSAVLSTISGDIDIDSDIAARKISRGRYVAGDGKVRLELSTISGDISIND